MLKIKFRFSQFFTQIDQIQKQNYGPLQQLDYKVLNINNKSSLRDIYYSYMKHIRLFEIQQQADKMQQVKESYLRIMQQRLKHLDDLEDNEKNDLRFLMDNNFGFPFVEGLRRSEMITEFQNQIEAKRLYHYPRIMMLLMWIVLGVPSLYFNDTYIYQK